jgi:hypothetical protein
MIFLAAASPATWSDLISSLPSLILSAGVAGVWVTAYLKNWIIQPGAHKDACDERDQWRKLYFEEHASHQRTREALVSASQRVDAATDTSKLVVTLVEALHQQAAVRRDPPAPAIPPAAGGGGA